MSSSDRKYPHGCFLPMNALTVHPQGQSHFCLTSKLPTSKDLATLNQGRLQTHQVFQSGEWPESCMKCFNKEAKGLESRRLRTWSRKERHYGAADALQYTNEATHPVIRHLDISFSNACNLSCAICSSEYSSGWIKHDKQAIEEGLEFREFTSAYSKVSRLSPELFEQVMKEIENIDLILIKGGEPTRDPQCLQFLQGLAQRKKNQTSIFIQSNGTTKPDKWLQGLDNLEIEVGISMDGWGDVFNWTRGPYFSEVLENIRALDKRDNIKSLSIDFTLSAFNVLHLPEFLKQIWLLKQELSKLKSCPVVQWVQQPYANPLTLPVDLRAQVLEQSEKTLELGKDFFMDSHFLVSLLKRPRASVQEIETSLRWFRYLKKIRGFSLGATESLLEEALTS